MKLVFNSGNSARVLLAFAERPTPSKPPFGVSELMNFRFTHQKIALKNRIEKGSSRESLSPRKTSASPDSKRLKKSIYNSTGSCKSLPIMTNELVVTWLRAACKAGPTPKFLDSRTTLILNTYFFASRKILCSELSGVPSITKTISTSPTASPIC